MQTSMHPMIQHRVTGVVAMRARLYSTAAELCASLGKNPPEQKVRFQVVNKGPTSYHIIERSTGKVKGFRFTWKAAINLCQVLEARADGKVVNIEGWVQ